MPKGLGQIFREASELPERDRAALAGLLIESLDPQDESEVEAAWEREIGRRITELDDGSVETVSWEDVRRQLFGRQDGRRSEVTEAQSWYRERSAIAPNRQAAWRRPTGTQTTGRVDSCYAGIRSVCSIGSPVNSSRLLQWPTRSDGPATGKQRSDTTELLRGRRRT